MRDSKKLRFGKWAFEQSDRSNNYHLYETKSINVKENNVKTDKFADKEVVVGYDMPLTAIIKVITEDEALIEFLKTIEVKMKELEASIIKQLKIN